MNDILESISNREWAALGWFLVMVAAINFSKPIRASFVNVLRAFFKPVITVPLLLAALYATGEIWLLKQAGWWSLANLKTTILWLITFAFVAMFQLTSIKDRKAGLGKITRDIVTVTSLFVFVTELHSFSLAIEIIALPVVAILVLLSEVAKHKPEHLRVANLLGCILGLVGLSYLGFSAWMTYQKWGETATLANALEFLIPIFLSAGFLPFLYAWRLYVSYSDMFATLAVVGIDKKLVPFARWLAITRIRGDLEMLHRWRQAILVARPSSKRELKHSLTALEALKAREASPPTVQPKDGWSPYLAMRFMSELGYEMGHYHHSFGDEWLASSPMREIGGDAIWKNNLAYYVEGSEHAATALRFKLNVNDPANGEPALDAFIVGCIHLLEQAVSVDAVQRMKVRIAPLASFTDEIPFGTVSLTREYFHGGIEGGYSLRFEICRG